MNSEVVGVWYRRRVGVGVPGHTNLRKNPLNTVLRCFEGCFISHSDPVHVFVTPSLDCLEKSPWTIKNVTSNTQMKSTDKLIFVDC